MLALTFEVDSQKYGLDVTQILEVLPVVPLRRLPHAPDYVSGVFVYRGNTVPVIDLSRLIGKRAAQALLSTRIVLVRHPGPSGKGRALGLLAERATNLEETGAQVKSPGFATPEAPFLGGLSSSGSGEGMIQFVNVEQLLPADLRERLFVEA